MVDSSFRIHGGERHDALAVRTAHTRNEADTAWRYANCDPSHTGAARVDELARTVTDRPTYRVTTTSSYTRGGIHKEV
jgi:hypothetical protein